MPAQTSPGMSTSVSEDQLDAIGDNILHKVNNGDEGGPLSSLVRKVKELEDEEAEADGEVYLRQVVVLVFVDSMPMSDYISSPVATILLLVCSCLDVRV